MYLFLHFPSLCSGHSTPHSVKWSSLFLHYFISRGIEAKYSNHFFAFFLAKYFRYGSLKRRTLISPRAWKASFSEFHKSYSPKNGQRFSFKSPDKPRRGTLSREGSTYAVSPQSPPAESTTSESRDLDAGSSHSEVHSSAVQEETAEGLAGTEQREENSEVGEEKVIKEEPEPKPAAESDNKGDGEKAPPSESSCELNNSCDSESLELQLSAADNGPLHIEETEDSPVTAAAPKPNGLENGDVSGFNSDTKDMNIPHKVCHLISTQLRPLLCIYHCFVTPVLQCFLFALCPIQDASAEKSATLDSKSTTV